MKEARTFSAPVHIIGCGGVGSHIAVALARMGIEDMHLYDGDHFEQHNLANQYLHHNGIGANKAQVLSELVKTVSTVGISARPYPYHVNKPRALPGVVFVCVDSMESREVIMRRCLHGHADTACVIETRMDSGAGVVHCFDPANERHCASWWEQFFTDQEAQNMAGCGGATSIVSAVLGTVAMALRSFEMYWDNGNCFELPNRQYLDFDTLRSRQVYWATDPDWD